MTSDAGFRCAATQVTEVENNSGQLLYDDFSDVASGWAQAREPVDAYFYGYHPTDFYHMQVSAPNDCLSINPELVVDNFMAEVEVFTAKTDTETGNFRYGITLRQTDDAFYTLMISSRTQTWQIYKGTADGLALITEGGNTSIRGETRETRNRIFVIANGPELRFFLNGELISTVVDEGYGSGRVGFLVNTLDETYAHIHFDSVAVWPLPSTVPPQVAGVLPHSEIGAPSIPQCRGSIVDGNTLVSFIAHTVVAGDSLASIADQYSLTAEEIMGANGKTIIDPD